VVLALALYGITKGIMYYRVKSAMDDMVIAASGHGRLTYGTIETDITGRVGVTDIAFEPVGFNGAIQVARMTVTGPDAWFFLRPDHLWSDQRQPMPPRLRLFAEGVEVPLDHAWSGAHAGVPQAAAPDGCAGQPLSDPDLLAALGVERLLLDADMGWDVDDKAGRLDADFAFDLQGLQSLRTRVGLAGVSVASLQEGTAMPELDGFELTFRLDPAFGQRIVETCAKRRGVAPEAYRDTLVAEQLAGIEAGGMRLGLGLRHALTTFYEQWGEVKLAARPKSPIGVMSLVFLPPERLVSALGLDLRVNDLVVSDLSLSFAGPAGNTGSGLAALFNLPAEQDGKPRAARPRYESHWVKVSPGALANHVNRDVRLYLSDQPPRVGRLVAYRDGVAEVEQRVHGGQFTAYVRLAEVARAEVEMRRLVSPAADSAAQ
jgi:hypothetical protein